MPATDLRPLPVRDDTMLGVCQAIEEDFGVSANWLRIALGGAVLVNPLVAVGAYGALGVAVGLSRWLAPVPAAPPAAVAATDEAPPLALAA